MEVVRLQVSQAERAVQEVQAMPAGLVVPVMRMSEARAVLVLPVLGISEARAVLVVLALGI